MRSASGLNEWHFAIFERRGEVADHLAVQSVRLLYPASRLGILTSLPGVKASSSHSCGQAFVREVFLVYAGGLETDYSVKLLCGVYDSCPSGLVVLEVLLFPIREADVEAVLTDVDSYVHSDRIHGILSLSSGYVGCMCRPMPLQPSQSDDHISVGAHAEERSCDLLGGFGLADTARRRWPSPTGHSFHIEPYLCYPNTH